MEVKIEKGNNYYFYTTSEKVMVCPKCKREYKARKACLHCSKETKETIPTREHIKEHTGKITLDLLKYNCTCIFGSWFRWGKHWRKNYPNTRCRHCSAAMRKIRQKEEENGN